MLSGLLGPEWEVKVASKSGMSLARTLKQLHDEVVAQIAVKRTTGAWFRHWLAFGQFGWKHPGCRRNQDNEKAFGRPSAPEVFRLVITN
jgi:hypothetical protein